MFYFRYKLRSMKYKIYLLIIITTLFLSGASFAQDCTVSLAAISGKYTGECKDGKANGIGASIGEDTYTGAFKEGLPNGRGKYIWKNGNWFEGEWVKGVKQGIGRMFYKQSGKDSIVDGYWKKDKYISQYEKPYVVITKTVHVTGITCKLMNNTRNEINLYLGSETANTPTSFNGSTQSKAQITDVQIINGSYYNKTVDDNYTKKILYTFEDVVYPYRAVYTVNNGNDMFEIEFFEPGKWMVEIRLSY